MFSKNNLKNLFAAILWMLVSCSVFIGSIYTLIFDYYFFKTAKQTTARVDKITYSRSGDERHQHLHISYYVDNIRYENEIYYPADYHKYRETMTKL